MPNKTSAKKALRQTSKRATKNARLKTHVKSLFKHTLEALKSSEMEKAKELATAFQKNADKAAKGNIISTNFARRKKSVLMKALNSQKKQAA